MIRAAVISAFCLAAGPFGAMAQSVPDNDIVTATVMPGWRDADGQHYAGLALSLAPGWKTYWRRPGEGGIPPVFDWSRSENISDVFVHFPVPNVYEQNGMQSIGYKDHVILPLAIRLDQAGRDAELRGTVLLGVCEDICIPVEMSVSARLRADATAGDARVRSAMEDRPHSASAAGVTDVACRIEPISDGLRLTATIAMPALGQGEIAVVELPDASIWISEAKTSRKGQSLTTQVDMVPPSAAPFALARQDVRITVLAAGQAVDIRGCS